MSNHDRHEHEHRVVCEDCNATWHDEMLDMADDARLDAMIELETAGVL